MSSNSNQKLTKPNGNNSKPNSNNNKNVTLPKKNSAGPYKPGSSRGKRYRASARGAAGVAEDDRPYWADDNILSPAVSQYMHALVDPWEAIPCSVPNQPPLMTRPSKYWARGTFSTSPVAGANGFGFIAVSPFNGVANDGDFVFYNSQALALPLIDVTTAGQFTLANSNADYQVSEFSGLTPKSARVVSCGLRIRNLTSALTRGGQCIGLAEPSHGTISTMTVTGMDAYQESARHGAKDLSQWIELLWRPVDTDDMDFNSTFFNPNVPNGVDMGFILVAPAGAPQTYEFEAFGIYELQGQLVTGKSFSVADTKGYDAVANTLVISPKLHKPHVRDQRIPEAAQKAANHVVKHMQTHGGQRYPPPKPADKSFVSSVLDMAPGIMSIMGAIL